MTCDEMLNIAMAQSAVDLSCRPEDFTAAENRLVISKPAPGARKYLELPFGCNLVSYGGNVVASVCPEAAEAVRGYVEKYRNYACFETPHIHVLDETIGKFGLKTCFMAEYFLPGRNGPKAADCRYGMRILGPEAFKSLYRPEWSNALCEKRKELDVLGVGAYDGEKLVGLAACSADCDSMWQIGIDVLPDYRRRGIASALTGRLALEIIKRGKVPFYCAAWSNIPSVKNAVRSGFRPAWVELTAKSTEFVNKMNG